MTSVSLPAPRRRLADRVGLVLSSLCAVHCLGLPVLLAMLGGAGAHFAHDVVHPAMAVVLVPVTFRAMRPASGGWWWLACGLAFVWVGLLAHLLGDDSPGTAFTLLGSGLLLVGHRLNGCSTSCTSPEGHVRPAGDRA